MNNNEGNRLAMGRQLKWALATSVCAGSLMAMPAAAQTAATQQAAPSQGGLQQIVVTARRVEESLQDVPLAVTAFSSEQLADQQIAELQDLNGVVPNMMINDTATVGGVLMTIRGNNSGNLPNISLDQRVAVYLDGVYLARSQGGSFQLADIQRLEVLKGPQGTQFGKNVTAGSINFITANPSGEAHAIGEVTWGNHGALRTRLTLETPEWNGFSLRATMVHDESDGDMKNPSGGADFGRVFQNNTLEAVDYDLKPAVDNYLGNNTETYFVALRYQDGPFTADLKGDYTKSYEYKVGNQTMGYTTQGFACGPAYLRFGLASNVGGVSFCDPNGLAGGFYDWQIPVTLDASVDAAVSPKKVNSVPGATSAAGEIKNRGLNLTLDYEVSDSLTVRSITGFRKLNTRSQIDLAGADYYLINDNVNALAQGIADFIGIPFTNPLPAGGNNLVCVACSYQFQKQKQWSEELQFIGNIGDNVDYLLGGYYFKETGYSFNTYTSTINPVFHVLGFVPGLVYDADGSTELTGAAFVNGDDVKINSQSKAVFGRLTFRPTDQIDIVVGARQTWDKKTNRISQFFSDVLASHPDLSVTNKDDRFTYDATVTYHINPDVNVYARWATAYLAGGFLRNEAFKPETTKSGEVGFKSELFDRRVRFNAAAFWQKSKDIQIATNNAAGVLIVDNVGTFKSTGAEGELTVSAAPGLLLNASVGYVKQKFSNAQRNTAPKWTLQFGGSYDIAELSDGSRFVIQADANYRSTYFGQRFPIYEAPFYDPDVVLPAQVLGDFDNTLDYLKALDKSLNMGDYWMANARFSLKDIPMGGGTGTVSLWSKNLFDKEHLGYGTNFGLTIAGYFIEGRTYGVDFKVDF